MKSTRTPIFTTKLTKTQNQLENYTKNHAPQTIGWSFLLLTVSEMNFHLDFDGIGDITCLHLITM